MTIGLLAALVSALLAATPGRPADQHTTPREAFDRGRTAFGRAEYKRAIELLHPLLYPEVMLDSEGEVVQAHRILGVSYLFSGQSAEAKREFHKLLELRPDYRFDPLLDPQQVVDAFNAVVKEEESEIVAIEARRKRRDQEIAARLQREARLHPPPRRSSATNATPISSTSSPSGRASFRTASAARGGCSSVWRRRWRPSRSAPSPPTSRSMAPTPTANVCSR